MTKIALLGASGRMGQAIRALVGEGDFELFEISAAWSAGNDASALVDALRTADIAVDFTTPEATATIVAALRAHPMPLVSGTTGLGRDAMTSLDDLAARMPILHDGNMSIGVAVLTRLVRDAAVQLAGYDIEISDVHHRDKRDAPSGTALQLGQAIASSRGADLNEVTRPTDGARTDAAQIGFTATRGGSVIGEHTVAFLGAHDRLEVTHIASDRKLFATGALHAAAWLLEQPVGRYRIADMVARTN